MRLRDKLAPSLLLVHAGSDLFYPYSYSNKSPPVLAGPLAVNDLLKRGQRLFEHELMGPEALIMDEEGRVYTGLGDGRIIRLDQDLGGFTTLLRTGADSGSCGKGKGGTGRVQHLLRTGAESGSCGKGMGEGGSPYSEDPPWDEGSLFSSEQ